MRQFKKAPAYAGRPLSLYVRRGNRTIGEDEVLEGDEWARFVEMGYLVEVVPVVVEPAKPVVVKAVIEPVVKPMAEPVAEPPAKPVEEPVAPPAEPVVEAHEEPRAEGTVTRSPFNKPPKKAKR